MESKICITCKEVYYRKGQNRSWFDSSKFCSRKCRSKESYNFKEKTLVNKNCFNCGGLIKFDNLTYKKQMVERKFCGTKCAGIYASAQHNLRLKELRRNKTCENCGNIITFKGFVTEKQIRERKYCKSSCRKIGKIPVRYIDDLRYITSKGYIAVKDLITNSSKLEHILKAEKVLNRKLKKDEIVHHIDLDKTNNKNSNLLICDRSYHAWLHREYERQFAKIISSSMLDMSVPFSC